MACRLVAENGSAAMRSPVKALLEVNDFTVACWLKRPDPSLQDSADTDSPASPKTLPDATLISLDGVCEVRMVDDRIEAAVGENTPATLGFPRDLLWHHILLERVDGEVSIWLDHRVQSRVVPNVPGSPPAEGAAVQVLSLIHI